MFETGVYISVKARALSRAMPRLFRCQVHCAALPPAASVRVQRANGEFIMSAYIAKHIGQRVKRYKVKSDAINLRRWRKERERYLGILWSFVVKARVNFECELAGELNHTCSEVREAAHLVPRSVEATRYDLHNGRCLCFTIHRHYHDYPVLWEAACMKYWRNDYELFTQSKWQLLKLYPNLDAVYLELLVLAESFLPDFPYHRGQIQKAREAYEQK